LPAPAEPLSPVSTVEPAPVTDAASFPMQSAVPASQPVENAIAVSASETRTPMQAEASQPASSASKPDTDGFVEQGRALLASGDIISARHFFEYAANRGSPTAARQVGETYDPVFLRHAAARGIAGDADKAAYWYLQAVEHGDPAAAEQLKRLLGREPS
jgi:TPR repeat protein